MLAAAAAREISFSYELLWALRRSHAADGFRDAVNRDITVRLHNYRNKRWPKSWTPLACEGGRTIWVIAIIIIIKNR